jgi:hypothetical protein
MVEIGAIVEDMRSMMGRLVGEDIEFVVRSRRVGLRAKLDPAEFEIMLMNLVSMRATPCLTAVRLRCARRVSARWPHARYRPIPAPMNRPSRRARRGRPFSPEAVFRQRAAPSGRARFALIRHLKGTPAPGARGHFRRRGSPTLAMGGRVPLIGSTKEMA